MMTIGTNAEPFMEEDEGVLNRTKWVRIMCDFSANGIWDKQGYSCHFDELPVSADVKSMIAGWQEWYEHSEHSEMSHWFDAGAHAAFGLFIARLVKRQLPDWTVIYFDEAAYLDRLPGTQRDQFEYEIDIIPDGTFSK